MNHHDHVRLIAAGLQRDSGGVWTEFGAGTGAFTLALRDIAGPTVEIIAVDDDPGSLRTLASAMNRHFPDTRLRLVTGDFSRPLELPLLDGILAANAIHYMADHQALLQLWRGYLKPEGRLVIVEYDTDRGNRWVPYPVSYAALGPLAEAAGFTPPNLLGRHPSRFLGGFYAAMLAPA